MGHPTRGSNGRFTGWTGSTKGRSGGGSSSRTIKTAHTGRTVKATKHSTFGAKAKAVASNRKVQVGAGVLVAGVAGRVAYNKAFPSKTYSKLGQPFKTNQVHVGGTIKRPMITQVKVGGLTYNTVASKTGRLGGTSLTTHVSKNTKNGTSYLGYVDSKRRPGRRGYTINNVYLDKSVRGKGISGVALRAHGAARPNRAFRASPFRSVAGQALAKSQGAAGLRKKKSKGVSAGKSITTQMDRNFSQQKVVRLAHLSETTKFVSQAKRTKTARTVSSAKLATGKRLKR